MLHLMLICKMKLYHQMVYILHSISSSLWSRIWVPSTTQLYDIDGDSVFSITITLFSDSIYEYKYINGNSWGNDEYVLGSCSAGNGKSTYLQQFKLGYLH